MLYWNVYFALNTVEFGIDAVYNIISAYIC